MKTLTCVDHFSVPADPERVFPLLCPVLEYRWIPHWRCELLHSASGVAEENCVFRTDVAGNAPMTWVVSRYEPPRRIEFTCFVPDLFVMRLKIALADEAAATRLEWDRRWLSLGPAGDRWIDNWSQAEFDHKTAALRGYLTHYLRTGEMLRS